MKNFSSITENLDITTKKYVDDNKVTSVDGLSGGTLTSPLKISGGNQSTASKISLDQSANGQITDSSTSTLFGFMSSTTLTVGGNNYALALRGSGTRPTYKGADLALYSDIATVPTDYVKYTAQTLTDAQKSQARSNIGAGTSNFDGTWDSLSGKPNIVQSTGQSTSDVMSQKAVTDELDKKANRSGDTFTGDVIISSGKTLKTDIIKSADGTKWIAEIRGGGLEIGGTSAPLRLYSSTRPIHANANKELAYTSDIPTNYVTTDTDWQEITSKKKFLTDQLIIANGIDIDASAPAPEANQYRYIDFLDKNDKRIGIVGASIDTNKNYGAYLQAGNVASMGVLSTPDGFGYSYGPIPPNKDNTNKLATTSWAGRRYKSIADFGFTSQTTVKAIVQKIIDNWYEYCTFACTNDNFNNFSDTPDGWGTLIIEVGSNALRPLISFTKQVGDSNSYKHWQANIVRGANNQVTEIQWYEIITTKNFSLSGTTLTITL